MSLTNEINNMLDDICGKLILTPEREKKITTEEIKTKYVDLMIFVKEIMDWHSDEKTEMPAYSRIMLEHVSRELEDRNKTKSSKITCSCGIIYNVYCEVENYKATTLLEYNFEKSLEFKSDYFHCPKCGTKIYMYGKIVKFLSDNSKYEVRKYK